MSEYGLLYDETRLFGCAAAERVTGQNKKLVFEKIDAQCPVGKTWCFTVVINRMTGSRVQPPNAPEGWLKVPEDDRTVKWPRRLASPPFRL